MKIAVIDLDSVAYYIGHPNKVLDAKGQPLREENKFVYIDKTEDELKNSAHYWMNEILTKSEATHYIAYIKGKNTIGARKEVADTYKSNRSTEQPKWWNLVKNYLIWEFRTIEVNDMEVDDAVNITRLALQDSFICAMDKDLLGLKGCHYKWTKNEWITVSEQEANYTFWCDMIAGQPGDAVKGLPGKGAGFFKSRFDGHIPTAGAVLDEYILQFGEYIGIKEFYKNYTCLKILDTYEGFEIPEPIRVK